MGKGLIKVESVRKGKSERSLYLSDGVALFEFLHRQSPGNLREICTIAFPSFTLLLASLSHICLVLDRRWRACCENQIFLLMPDSQIAPFFEQVSRGLSLYLNF